MAYSAISSLTKELGKDGASQPTDARFDILWVAYSGTLDGVLPVPVQILILSEMAENCRDLSEIWLRRSNGLKP